jgi:hypothetical protein
MATAVEERIGKLDQWKSDVEFARQKAKESLGGNFRLKNSSRRTLHRLRHSLTVSHVAGTMQALGYVQTADRRIIRTKGLTQEQLDSKMKWDADVAAAKERIAKTPPAPRVRITNYQPPKQFTAAQRRARRTNRRYGN